MTNLLFARQSAGSGAHQEYSGERLLNCYSRPEPDGGVGPFIIAWSPGLTPWVTLSAGDPVRAVLRTESALWAVCGGTLWQVVNNVATARAAIPDAFLTSLAWNGRELAIAAGEQYYVWTGSLATITTGAFNRVANIVAIDNYVVAFEREGQRFSISGLADASTWDALDFASAEGAPDHLIAGHADHGELWLFGTKSTEIWSNNGGGDFPFARFASGYLQRGARWPRAIVSEDNAVWFVGDDRVVYRAAVGGSPQRVSTQWVEEILTGYADDAEVYGFGYTHQGQKVYALRLPDRPALLFDVAAGRWHERNTGVDGGPWIATCSAHVGEATVLGGSDGKLHRLGGPTDGGQTIAREGVSLPFSQQRERVTINGVTLHFKTGATDIGRDAQVMLQCSRDGRTWGRERWRPMGARGEYDRLVRWWGFGQARQFRFRWRITDPIDGALYGASLEVN